MNEREELELEDDKKNVKPLNDVKFSGFFGRMKKILFLSLYHVTVIYYQGKVGQHLLHGADVHYFLLYKNHSNAHACRFLQG